MIWKFIIVISVFAIIIGGIVWIAQGTQFYTKNREKVVTIIKDDLFGTTHEHTEWVETFKLGILPDDSSLTALHRSYAFIIGTGTAAIILSIVMLRRKKVT